jgi:hypothetical protein
MRKGHDQSPKARIASQRNWAIYRMKGIAVQLDSMTRESCIDIDAVEALRLALSFLHTAIKYQKGS